MDRKIYDAMMGVEDNIDYPPHTLTSGMPHKIVDALKAAGFTIVPAADIASLKLANKQSMAQADMRSAENVKLRQENERLRDIARAARDHVPPDLLARIDAALGAEQQGDQK